MAFYTPYSNPGSKSSLGCKFRLHRTFANFRPCYIICSVEATNFTGVFYVLAISGWRRDSELGLQRASDLRPSLKVTRCYDGRSIPCSDEFNTSTRCSASCTKKSR